MKLGPRLSEMGEPGTIDEATGRQALEGRKEIDASKELS